MAETESFSFTLTKVALVEGMEHWLHRQPEAPWFEYASGFYEPRKAEVWLLAQEWAAKGLVHLVTARPLENRNWKSWRMVRRSAPVVVKPLRADDIARPQLVVLHRLLVEAAEAGLPCPSRSSLAPKVTGREDTRAKQRVSWLMRRLEAEGRIAITPAPRGAQHGPKVTILTGKHKGAATAWPDRAGKQQGV